MAGMSAACKALGPAGYPRITAALHAQDNASTPATHPHESGSDRNVGARRHRGSVQCASWATPTIRDITLRLPTPALWHAGQYALVRVAPFEWRPYSLACEPGHAVRLLIDVRTRGLGAAWASHVTAGDTVDIELPLGQFLLNTGTSDTRATTPDTRRRVFIATGTGIAPFLAEFERDVRNDDVLLLGYATTSDDPTTRLDTPLPRVIRCVSRENTPGTFHGRVTNYLREAGIDTDATYYVCGSPLMVADAAHLIRDAGGRVRCESF